MMSRTSRRYTLRLVIGLLIRRLWWRWLMRRRRYTLRLAIELVIGLLIRRLRWQWLMRRRRDTLILAIELVIGFLTRRLRWWWLMRRRTRRRYILRLVIGLLLQRWLCCLIRLTE